jgi:hypothetical protein
VTTLDIVFIAFAVIDLIALAVMAWVGLQFMRIAKQGQRTVGPALREARQLATLGKAMATETRTAGMDAFGRIKAVARKVKQRVETTRRIAGELKPARETAATAADVSKDLAARAHTAGDMVQRLGRVKRAADAAVRAARNP